MKDNLISERTSSGVPVFHSRGDADLTSYRIAVKAGSRYESVDGISHVMEHMSFKGTTTRTKDEIQDTMDSYGGAFNAYTGNDWIVYQIDGQSRGSEEMLDVLTDMVCNPSLLESELVPEKEVILQEMAMRDNDPRSHFFGMIGTHIWRGSSIGHKVIGDEESVRGIDSEVLRGFHQDMFIRENMAVFASGNVDLDMVLDKTQDTLGALPSGTRSSVPVTPFNKGDYLYEEASGGKTCYGAICYPTVISPDEYASFIVLADILADGLSSRIVKELRDRRALIYAPSSIIYPYLGCSTFCPGFTTTGKNVREAMGALAEVMHDVKVNGVTAKELNNVRAKIQVGLQSDYEGTAARLDSILGIYRRFETVQTLEERVAAYEEVTVESVQALAQRIMDPGCMHVVLYGNEDDGMKEYSIDQLDI
ncbi:MAG: insulinase family protein [archaeon]|nr:insulinase family protein [archaeon]